MTLYMYSTHVTVSIMSPWKWDEITSEREAQLRHKVSKFAVERILSIVHLGGNDISMIKGRLLARLIKTYMPRASLVSHVCDSPCSLIEVRVYVSLDTIMELLLPDLTGVLTWT